MTENELRRLRRQDLLQLLLTQSQETDRLKALITDREAEAAELRQTVERLKDRLNGKDEQLDRLKERLEAKDVSIRELRQQLAGKDTLIERLARADLPEGAPPAEEAEAEARGDGEEAAETPQEGKTQNWFQRFLKNNFIN